MIEEMSRNSSCEDSDEGKISFEGFARCVQDAALPIVDAVASVALARPLTMCKSESFDLDQTQKVVVAGGGGGGGARGLVTWLAVSSIGPWWSIMAPAPLVFFPNFSELCLLDLGDSAYE